MGDPEPDRFRTFRKKKHSLRTLLLIQEMEPQNVNELVTLLEKFYEPYDEYDAPSPNTVRKTKGALIRMGLIRELESRLCTTLAGDVLIEDFDTLLKNVRSVENLTLGRTVKGDSSVEDSRLVLERIPISELGAGTDELRTLLDDEFTVTVSRRGVPDQGIERFSKLVEEADYIRKFVIAPVQQISEIFDAKREAGSLQGEEIYSTSAIENYLGRPHYRTHLKNLFSEALENDDLNIRVYEGEFPFGFNIMDETIVLTDSRGEIVIESESETLRKEWAEPIFEEKKSEAVPLGEWIDDRDGFAVP